MNDSAVAQQCATVQPFQYHSRYLLELLSPLNFHSISGADCRAWFAGKRVGHFMAQDHERFERKLRELAQWLGIEHEKLLVPKDIREMPILKLDDRLRKESAKVCVVHNKTSVKGKQKLQKKRRG